MIDIFKKRFFSINQSRKRIHRFNVRHLVYGVVSLVLILHCATLIVPFIWIFISSFKGSYEYLITSFIDMPEKWLVRNYMLVFNLFDVKGTKFLGLTINSLWWTFGNAVVGIFASSVVAYCFAKFDFKAKKFMYAVIIFIMIVPIFSSGASAYKQAQDLKIINTPFLMIKSMGGYGGFNFLVLYAFFRNLSWSYAEAALIDGAGHFKIFITIMMPLAAPPILSLAVISSISIWNDYMTPLVYMRDYPTLATGLYVYETSMTRATNYPVYFAGVLLSLIPILTVFIFFQNTIMENVTAGGLKG